jgi:hypothetical protein
MLPVSRAVRLPLSQCAFQQVHHPPCFCRPGVRTVRRTALRRPGIRELTFLTTSTRFIVMRRLECLQFLFPSDIESV